MSSILTSDKLIRSIKRRGFLPNDQVTFTDEDFLEMATEEITIGLMEQIIIARGEYLVYHIDVPIVDGVNRYDIPTRAHGVKLRDACINDIRDPETVLYDLFQASIEDLADIENYYAYNTRTVFYVENNQIVLSKDIVKGNTFNLRMYFYMRPNKLVVNNRAGIVQSITDGTEIIGSETVATKTLSFMTIPKHFSTAIEYDITTHKSPNKILSFSLVPVSVNLTLKTVTFKASDLDPSIQVGNYVTQAEETIVPNLPTEYHPVVAQRTVRACMEAMNDDAGFAKASAKLAEMEQQVLKIVTNRVEGAPKKIKNRGGTLRAGLNKTYKRW
jgi:hypothetical protein